MIFIYVVILLYRPASKSPSRSLFSWNLWCFTKRRRLTWNKKWKTTPFKRLGPDRLWPFPSWHIKQILNFFLFFCWAFAGENASIYGKSYPPLLFCWIRAIAEATCWTRTFQFELPCAARKMPGAQQKHEFIGNFVFTSTSCFIISLTTTILYLL